MVLAAGGRRRPSVSGWNLIHLKTDPGVSGHGSCVAPVAGDDEQAPGDYASNGVIVWAVFAPTADVAPGALAGNDAGATAAVGVGVGANALFGGSSKQFALQPVSIQGMTGLNVAGGIAALELKSEE